VLNEFRAFVMRGSVVDLAVGLVMGVAFGTVVNSFVNDLLMPPIGLLLGSVDFTNLFITLRGGPYPTLAAAKAAGAPTLNYGLFLNHVISLLIVGFAVFLLVRQVNRLKGPPPPPTTRECPACATPVPAKARRCPHCTSDIGGAGA
jgi:large conductance mechanosensitive channel